MRQRLFCVLMAIFWTAVVVPVAVISDPGAY